MRQILWFRRDLRVSDSAILSYAQGDVLPIFIFDTDILSKLDKDDKRVTFIHQSVLNLKKELKSIGLDLAIFYAKPKEVFESLKDNFDEVLCSCDFDTYSIARDKEIESIIKIRRYYDSYLVEPSMIFNKSNQPYKVYTHFFNSLQPIWSSHTIDEYRVNNKLRLVEYDYTQTPSIESIGFRLQRLPDFLYDSADDILQEFIQKLDDYQVDRDFFYKDASSKLSVHIRFGLISIREVFNRVRVHDNSQFFIKELFWREFYNYILYHFPYSETKNFNHKPIEFSQNREHFEAWCSGNTGVPIVDAAMRHFNKTSLMHNRLRMIVSSYLSKNLFLPWQWGEQYFAKHLLDYDASSNIGSWQWSASTGADSVPYFRVFNPYTQSKKFDKDAIFIKSVIPQLKDVDPSLIHKENGLSHTLFVDYPAPIVDTSLSRKSYIDYMKSL